MPAEIKKYYNNYRTMGIYISIIIICIICIIGFYYREVFLASMLTGFWKCDPDFCADADLELFIMHFGEPVNGTIPMYLLAKNNDGFILNNQCKLIMKQDYTTMLSSGKKKFSGKFDIDNDHFPAEQEIIYEPLKGKLIFKTNETVYAAMYKCNIMSDE